MTNYNATIETRSRAVDEATIDRILDQLAGFSPAISWTSRGALTVTITMTADTLRQATASALALVETAVGKAHAIEAMPTVEYDQRTADVPMPDLVGATEAASILGLTRQRVQQMADAGQLPVTRIGRALAFPRSTIAAMAVSARRSLTDK